MSDRTIVSDLDHASADPWMLPADPVPISADATVESAGVEPTGASRPDVSTAPDRSPRRRVLFTLAIALVLIVAATWFSNAQSVEEVAIEGSIGIRAEATLSAAAVAQNRVAQSLLIAEAVGLELSETSELDRSLVAAESAVVELDRRLALVHQDLGDVELAAAGLSYIRSLEQVLIDVEAGELGVAQADMATLDAGFGELARMLAANRDAAFTQIAIARDTAGQVAVGARILVAFLIPMMVVLGYRFVVVRATRRRELQRALAEERETLRAKDELIANISHELRTPLTGILGFSQEAALERSLGVDELRSMAGVVAGEANELSRMVDDLITTARDQEGALALSIEPVDPNDEVDAVLIPALIAGRRIAVDLPTIPVAADRLRLRQILRNLVSNALKYGGPSVALKGIVDDEFYHLSVVDNGAGVAPQLEKRLFTRFLHRGDAPLMTGSVGLGLSIAKRLAEMMGGNLGYEHTSGRTVFTLQLPLAR